jgi:competence ComEA-like helix-hairpin-helix protein
VQGDPDAIDLSSASEEELLELSGVGPALARRIVAWREEHGGFESVDQLSEVRGISPRVLEELRPHVRADPFTYITVDAIRDPDLALSESLRWTGDGGSRPNPARQLAAEPRSRVARLRAFATENVGNALLIALIAVVELAIVVMLVRAL